MVTNQISLFNVFDSVVKALQQNKTQLNQADTYNHDHGDNMVEIFDVVRSAMQAKANATPAEQLEYAAQLLRNKESGSARYYSQSLDQASQELQGQKAITTDNAMTLLQTLLGGGQASTQSAGTAGDLLGSLISSLGGAGTSTTTGKSTIDWATLANAGLEYLQSKQEGKDTMTSLMDALMSDEGTQKAPYRKQSGTIVANTLMQALGSVLNKTS